jgi:ATP-binding protein involved in chromosome partitioning
MSMGYLLPKSSPTTAGSPVAWRGAMVQKALQQLLFSVAWPATDILVLDLPPGTGDTQLTITQSLTLSGAIIVSTPQDLALADVVRGIALFQAPGVGVRILGAVQNMSVFVCPKCGEETNIFGQDGLRRKCEALGVEVLGDVPLDARICEDADRGKPTVVSEPKGVRAEKYVGIARRVAEMVGLDVKA